MKLLHGLSLYHHTTSSFVGKSSLKQNIKKTTVCLCLSVPDRQRKCLHYVYVPTYLPARLVQSKQTRDNFTKIKVIKSLHTLKSTYSLFCNVVMYSIKMWVLLLVLTSNHIPIISGSNGDRSNIYQKCIYGCFQRNCYEGNNFINFN